MPIKSALPASAACWRECGLKKPRKPCRCSSAQIDEYEQAAAWNRDVVVLANLTGEALFCMPACLQWSIASIPDADAVSPDPILLEQLIGNLERSLSLLDRPAAVALPDVRRLRHELESLLDTCASAS